MGSERTLRLNLYVSLPASSLEPGARAHAYAAREGPQNDPAEFAAACERHLDQVWRQLRAMGVPLRWVDDATQDVFLIAHAKFPSFEHRSQLGTWLYAITHRVGCNYRRRASREPHVPLDEAQQEAHSRDPEASLIDKRSAEFVQRFSDGLSEKLRDVFVLCLLEGQSATAVATLLNVPENTIYSRIRLVREAFQRAIARTTEVR
jgi:RNA polymerase sigma-70 factor (ECF subfamily)